MQTQYFVQPYTVGKEKRSLAMILPFGLVKSLGLEHHSTLLLLKVIRQDEIKLLIVRQEELEKKVAIESTSPIEQEEKNQ